MTNAEVFIGDEELIDTFIEEFCDFAYKEDGEYEYCGLPELLEAFFKKERKPKPELTEDEKIILKNIGEDCISLIRNNGEIYFHTEGHGIFPNLFKFIKEGEEYEIKELLK